MNNPTKLHELSWLGGIIDGEGSICLSKHGSKYDPRLQITNTNLVIPEKARMIFLNNGIYNVRIRSKSRSTRPQEKTCYELEIDLYSDLLLALSLMQEYLISKQKQCSLLREFLNLRAAKLNRRSPYTPREVEIFEELKLLNKRGV